MDKSTEETGVVRTLDEYGRITLPRELRKLLNVREGCRMEIGVVDGDKFIISKYSPMNTLKEWGSCIVSSIGSVVEHDIILTDLEKTIDANKKKYLKLNLSSETIDLIYKREVVIKKADEGSVMIKVFNDIEDDYRCELIVPIIKNSDVLGAIMVLASENKCFDDDTIKVCKAFANFLNCVVQ